MTLSVRNFIDGASADSDGATIPFMAAATGTVLGQAPQSTEADVDAAFAAADRAAATWSTSTPRERQAVLLGLADRLERHAEELVEAEVRNTGKPRAATLNVELGSALDQIRFFAGACRTMNGTPQTEYAPAHSSSIRREPVGVVAQITPWNYPLMMAAWKIAPAIAAGNTVVLKPAETTPLSTVRLAELSAGILPPGVLNVVCGDGEVGARLVRHPRADMVAITGSTRAGSEVMRSAADDVKNVHLELGGKAPAVVLSDAELATAATTLAQIGLFNAGQDCTAPTRLLVQETVAAEFVDLLTSAMSTLRPGAPDDSGAYFGPLNSARHLAAVQGYLDRLPPHATVVTGGRSEGPGYFLEPTVVTGVRQHDEIVQEEVFGPVLTVQTFQDDDEALRLANDIRYGLASSVWGRDSARLSRFSRGLEFGCVWVNCHGLVVSEMPHGGYKRSGIGKDLSMWGLEEYTRIKHVMTRH
ncbi:aminobutyraldehyde dehydrogenase [Nocardioides sp. L-11A]|uniref:aminobutyraldehyde dehydrogenase n=1 Tax=Nocardioides sp. L-11A TaxID=3043848 RepID=UPI00249A6189|nr:aminobutyraldehyde dehydrogenase [Nocardioides sp. L-11A]